MAEHLNPEQCSRAIEVMREYLSAPANPDGRTPCEANVELDQKRFILRVHRFEELQRGLARNSELIAHTAACVKDQADRQRRILSGKVRDRLFGAIFEEMKVLFRKA